MLGLLRRKGRILLLDDDAAMQRLMSLLLKRNGYQVDVVSKGNEAIAALGSKKYDAVLLDLMMPYEGGITVMNYMREKKPELLRRVLLVTGAPESVLRSVKADVFGVVSKPFESEELVAAVARLVAS